MVSGQDYSTDFDSASFTLAPTTSGTSYLWGKTGVSLYSPKTGAGSAKSKYAVTFQPSEYKLNLTKSAKVLRMEMRGTVKGFKASLQNMTIWAKQGKIR